MGKSNMKKIIASVLSANILLGCLNVPAASADSLNLDINSDGDINCFDLILMRRELRDINMDLAADLKDYTLLVDFLLGKEIELNIPDNNPEILEPKGTIHYGEGTYYGGGYKGGCAMLDPISKDDYWIVAMNLEDYNNAQLAGAYIEVTGESGTINMLVTDLLPEGKKGDLDLYVEAFPLIAPAIKGRVPVSWKIIPLNSAENAPMSYKFKTGSSQFWCGVQVRNHRYPINKLEYLDADGNFVEIPRKHYNYFESDKMGAGPFTFRITDIYGQSVIERDIPLVLDEIVEGHEQLPL